MRTINYLDLINKRLEQDLIDIENLCSTKHELARFKKDWITFAHEKHNFLTDSTNEMQNSISTFVEKQVKLSVFSKETFKEIEKKAYEKQ